MSVNYVYPVNLVRESDEKLEIEAVTILICK